MRKIVPVIIVSAVVVTAIVMWFYLHQTGAVPIQTQSTSISKTYTSPDMGAVPRLSFTYPADLGNVVIKTPSKIFLSLGFDARNADIPKLKFIFSIDKSLGENQTFQEWTEANYGYVPTNEHNPQIVDDTSIATITSIGGREALRVVNYTGDMNHSLYLLNLGNGSVLIFGIQGAFLANSVRDDIAGSIKL